ncbi:DUF2066 domain-containing protein [Parashewanella spongiae]|uniref:DUF2066 domain-containing protein n=2 Tax=Parashewanella spongiae TaxID=342950 RepID=A0A3A6TRG4_9GAMM|nr:DUF2066 domain-containing protein [Parashewanella spongiae]RJY18714.1 DUF2066 domain-containing protein [Parashewanella spongiae]
MTLNTKKLILLLFCCFLFSSFHSKAVLVQKLNEASITVKSKSKIDTNSGIAKALEHVFIKNSGSFSILNNEQIKSSIKKPRNLMNQFSFEERNGELKLNVVFEEQKVLALLRSAKVPVWGKQRPSTLLWTVLAHDSNDFEIMSETTVNELSQSINVAANEYSVPVLFPIMDFTESTSISGTDIKELFVDRFYELSARYNAGYFALVSISESGSMYSYSLNLYNIDEQGFNKAEIIKSGKAKTSPELSQALINSLSEYYSKKFAVITADDSDIVHVTFEEISDLKGLISLENYLKEFTIIQSLYTSGINNRSVTFRIKLYGTKDDLYRTLKLDKNIVESQFIIDSNNANNSINYRWQVQ